MKKIVLMMMLVMVSFAFLSADVYVKQEGKTPEFMGQPGKTTITEQWFSKTRIATISDAMTVIVNLEQKKVYMVFPKTKTYIESNIPLDMASLFPEEMAAMMKGMLDGMTVTVQPNNQTKKIATWDTIGYDGTMTVMGMEMKMTFWVTPTPGFNWKEYSDLFTEVYKVQMRMSEKAIAEFKKIQGFPVYTEIQMMGMTITTSVIEIDPNKTPTPGIYTVPAGFTKKDKLAMDDMKQQ
jgi:hypothetical protein